MNELRHLVDPLDLSFEETLRLLDLADSIANDRTAFAHKCEGKILATLFYEPSTRTRLSFEAAMYAPRRQGIWASARRHQAPLPRVKASRIRCAWSACYADIIAMRHQQRRVRRALRHAVRTRAGHQRRRRRPPAIRRRRSQTCSPSAARRADFEEPDGRSVRRPEIRTHRSFAYPIAMSRYKGVKFVLISPGGAARSPLHNHR